MFDDNSGQISAELILLLACILTVVLIAVSMYNDYLENLVTDINDSDVNILKNKIDKINDFMR